MSSTKNELAKLAKLSIPKEDPASTRHTLELRSRSHASYLSALLEHAAPIMSAMITYIVVWPHFFTTTQQYYNKRQLLQANDAQRTMLYMRSSLFSCSTVSKLRKHQPKHRWT